MQPLLRMHAHACKNTWICWYKSPQICWTLIVWRSLFRWKKIKKIHKASMISKRVITCPCKCLQIRPSSAGPVRGCLQKMGPTQVWYETSTCTKCIWTVRATHWMLYNSLTIGVLILTSNQIDTIYNFHRFNLHKIKWLLRAH